MRLNAATAALEYALNHDCIEGMDDTLNFLRLWNEGEFDVLRNEYEDIPEEVFIGADPLHPQTKELQETEDHICEVPWWWRGVWQHLNGNQYRVIGFANVDSVTDKHPPTVIYKGVANDKIWSRPINGWSQSMKRPEYFL